MRVFKNVFKSISNFHDWYKNRARPLLNCFNGNLFRVIYRYIVQMKKIEFNLFVSF